VWVERQSEFSGAFQIKLSATALSQLMCSDHAALDQIQARSPPRCCRCNDKSTYQPDVSAGALSSQGCWHSCWKYHRAGLPQRWREGSVQPAGVLAGVPAPLVNMPSCRTAPAVTCCSRRSCPTTHVCDPCLLFTLYAL